MFKRGDHVELLESHRDPDDDTFIWIVVGDEEKGRVDISPVDIAMQIKPIHTVRADWIRHAASNPQKDRDRDRSAGPG